MGIFLNYMKPELMISLIIFLLLILKLGKGMTNAALLPFIQVLILIGFLITLFLPAEGSLFHGMYRTGRLIGFQKAVLLLGVYLISLLCSGWLKKSEHLTEFIVLMLSALLGMFFLLSSGHLVMFFLSLELATIPVAAMSNFDLDKKASSEAAMKMILSSAFASGILLFGISLIYGITGTLYFDALVSRIEAGPLQVMAFVFLFSAFAFKLSVVPFHLWTADVYEGSPFPVTAFLSVVSKGAVAFTFVSVLYRVFQPLGELWHILLMITAVSTLVIGNLFALRQDNIKRFLAFSSIAQVGFILVGITANDASGTASVTYFILVYLFSNLAAFGVASVIADSTGRENISDYRGLYASHPMLCWVMALALFSLAGIPPTAGFFGKVFLLGAGASRGQLWLIVIAALNMVISLYYYLRVVRAMFMEKQLSPIGTITQELPVRFALLLCVAGILLTGLLSWIYEYIRLLI